MILATLQNPEPKVLSRLAMTADLKNVKTGKIVKQVQGEKYVLAPNSRFNFEMDWGTSDIVAGTYMLSIVAKSPYSDWKFEKEFTITGDQASSMNEQSAFKIITPTWIKVVTIICLIVMVSVTGMLLVRRKKWKQNGSEDVREGKGRKRKKGNK
ncbi:WxL protein host-binding domain-containing protein [Enterococcus termitis]